MPCPIILYELLAFITPGLTDQEKRWVFYSIPFATLLFLVGVSFTYFVMMPVAIPFLINFMNIKTTPRPSIYIDFVTGMMFWVGVLFEMPLIVFILAKIGLITASFLLKGWRFAIVIIAVIAAMVTPTTDPINMGILMVPLLALYFLSVGLAAIAGRDPLRKPKVSLVNIAGRPAFRTGCDFPWRKPEEEILDPGIMTVTPGA